MDEPRHLHGRDEALSLALAEPNDSHGWVRVVPWDKASDLPPVEHLAHDFQYAVSRVGVLRAGLGVNRLDVRGHDTDREARLQFGEDASSEPGLILLPFLLFLLRVIVDVRRAQLLDRLE